jgi:hypothetical protein
MHSLINRDRTEITPRDYFKHCTAHIILQIFLGLSLGASMLVWLGVSFVSIAIAVALASIPALLCLRFRHKTRRVIVKGDTLILKNYHKRSLVTSLRSVKKVRTFRLPGVYVTRLEYNLDGVNRSTVIVNRSWTVAHTPEQLMRKAIDLSRKERKKKANHKPGSVH